MLNRLSGGARAALCLPVAYGGALLVSAPLTPVLGATAAAGAVIGLLFGGWLGFVGSSFAPSPRWRPALFFAVLALFISWSLLRGDGGDYWTARSRVALITAIVGGAAAVVIDRRQRARAIEPSSTRAV